MTKIETESIARVVDAVKDHVRHHLRCVPVHEAVSLDAVEGVARDIARRSSASR
mgnify:CR=1 FL=1